MRRLTVAVLVALVALLVVPIAMVPAASKFNFRTKLLGFEEVPAVSSTGLGEFRAQVSDTSLSYELSYVNLEGAVQQAHIHLGQKDVNGGIVLWLCSNLPSPPTPPGTPPCPGPSGTVTGTLGAGNVQAVAAQGIAAGEFNEVIRALRAGVTYANVHTDKHPPGEIRGQNLEPKKRGDK